MGLLDDTLVFYVIGDNGASAEGTLTGTFNAMFAVNGGMDFQTPEFLREHIDEIGGPPSYPHYAVGWAHAMCTPYQWTKQVASHWGGTRNATIVHCPNRIAAKGELRHQFSHVIDVAPTILEMAGLPEPTQVHGVTQRPMEGVSMAYSFDDAPRSSVIRPSTPRCSATAARMLPEVAGRPTPIHGTSQTLYPGMGTLNENCVLNVKYRSHQVTAEVVVPDGGAEGVLINQGGITGGWSLYLEDGRPTYTYSFCGQEFSTAHADEPLAGGEHQVRVEFAYDGGGLGYGGTATLYVDGDQAASARVSSSNATAHARAQPPSAARTPRTIRCVTPHRVHRKPAGQAGVVLLIRPPGNGPGGIHTERRARARCKSSFPSGCGGTDHGRRAGRGSVTPGGREGLRPREREHRAEGCPDREVAHWHRTRPGRRSGLHHG